MCVCVVYVCVSVVRACVRACVRVRACVCVCVCVRACVCGLNLDAGNRCMGVVINYHLNGRNERPLSVKCSLVTVLTNTETHIRGQ